MSQFTEHKHEISCGGSSWCTHCGKAWDTGDPDPPSCEFPAPPPPRYIKEGVKIFSHAENVKRYSSGHRPSGLDKPRPSPPNKGSGASRSARTEIALTGFLAAKLATYEPDSDTVKQALEYLKNV